MDYKIIDADAHLNSPPDLWLSRVPAKYRERAPKIVHLDECDAWTVDGKPPQPLTILAAAAGKRPEDLSRRLIRFDEMRPGCHDPKARLEDMDLDGIDAQVLYGDGAMGAGDPELRNVLIRAYNDWQSEFCSTAPERLIGQAIVPAHDPAEAVAEAIRTADMPGLRGIFMGIEGADYPITDPGFDRFWAVAAEQRRPVAIHMGASSQADRKAVFQSGSTAGVLATFIACTPMTVSNSIGKLIFSGTLARHPDLKIVIAEGGIGWLAYFIERMDHVAKKQGSFTGLEIDELPSSYFRRQILATFEEDLAGMRTYDLIGAENIMWSSDFPHADTTWPHSRKVIEEHFAELPEADRIAMTCGNAGRIYGLLS